MLKVRKYFLSIQGKKIEIKILMTTHGVILIYTLYED